MILLYNKLKRKERENQEKHLSIEKISKIDYNENGRKNMMKKIGNIILTFIQIVVILGLVMLIGALIYFFFYKGYNINQIEEATGVSFNFTEENTIQISEIPLRQETEEFTITGIEDTNSYQSNTFDQEIPSTDKGYYYSQLDTTAKQIYEVLEQNRANLKTGVYEITLPEKVTNVLYEESGDVILGEAFQGAWDAFIYDYTDMFFIDTSKVCLLTTTTTIGSKKTYQVTIGKGENSNYFEEGFSSYEDVQNAIYQLEDIRTQMKNQLVGNSDYDKIKKVHDWLVDNIEYDTTLGRTNNHNIYGAFIERNVVCEGYAKAFKYIMDELDIPCILVKGIGTNSSGETEKHMWNYVYIENNWYAIDVTWDDPIIEGNGWITKDIKYAYFLKGSKEFNKSHQEEGQISVGGKVFSYPMLSIENYE